MSNSSDSMDCSLPGFSVHEILQARILEWVAISFSRRYLYLLNEDIIQVVLGFLYESEVKT